MNENDKKLAERLDALGKGGLSARSKVSRLRLLYDHVDGALWRSSWQEVLDALNADGFEMTMATFKSAMQRIRKERERAAAEEGERKSSMSEAFASGRFKSTTK